MPETDAPETENLVALLRGGSAPAEIRSFAARNLLPLDPDDSLRALLAVLHDPDPETASLARESFLATSPDRLAEFVRTGAPSAQEVDLLARSSDDPFVLEEIVRSRAADGETLVFLARTASGRPQEALVANQARLLSEPELLEALLENPTLTTEGRRLLSELQEEFFEKERRRREALAASTAAAAEAAEAEASAASEDSSDELDDLDAESDASEAGEPADSATPDADGERESLFIGAIYKRISTMTIHERINLAYVGSKEERRILIGDTNKLIGIAVLKSRALSINEVESFAAMRNLDEEIYRRISQSREWMRKPGVVLALVRNPRTPLDIVLPLLKQLPVRELRAVFRDRNLAPVVRQAARRFLVMKRR